MGCAFAFEMLIVAKRRLVNGRPLRLTLGAVLGKGRACPTPFRCLGRQHAAGIPVPGALPFVIYAAPGAETPGLPRGVHKPPMEGRRGASGSPGKGGQGRGG